MKTTEQRITEKCAYMEQKLQRKRGAYGDSITNPIRVLSTASPLEQLLVRIDDKLSRLARGSEDGEDTYEDLAGYFIMLLIARDVHNEQASLDRLPKIVPSPTPPPRPPSGIAKKRARR